MRRDSANLKTLLTILSTSFLSLTVIIGALAYFFLNPSDTSVKTHAEVSSGQSDIYATIQDAPSAPQQSSSSTEDLPAASDISPEENAPPLPPSSHNTASDALGITIPSVSTPAAFNVPELMRGVMIVPGIDYLTDLSASDAAVQKEIDTALEHAADLGMNSVILDTKYNEHVMFQSDVLSSMVNSMDYIDYLIDKSRDMDLFVYATYDVTDLADGDKTYYRAEALDGDTLDSVYRAAADFAQNYQLDGILLSNYYQTTSGQSYAAYLTSGGGMGFSTYNRQVPRSLLGTVAQLIRQVAPSTQVGLLSDAVWANASHNDLGTQTSAAFTALYDGNADTRAMLHEGLFDFVMVKNYGSTSDQSEPFSEVAQWWAQQGQSAGVTVYMLHASDRVGSQRTGWGAYEQLASQVVALDKITGISGSAFNSLKQLVNNPGNSATMLVQYMQGDVNEQYILSQLSMSQPAQTSFSTEELSVTFQGASDPQEKVTVNGQEISTDSNGYFSVPMPLSPGSNKFVIVHKSKSVTYTIERIVEVVRNVYPTGSINVEGGMEIIVTAHAYENAVVTASLGGQTITMSPTEDVGDEALRNSGYVLYEGRFTAPAAASQDVQMGAISVTGVFEGISTTAQGASVTVNKIVQVGTGGVVQVVADQAETYPVNTLNNISDPNHYPLPKGTIDTTVGQEVVYKSGSSVYTYWKLASGVRVLAEDLQAVSVSPPNNNAISGVSVSAGGMQTLVKVNTAQKVPYTVTYDGYKIIFNFKYTTSVPETVDVGTNAMFSAAQFSDSSLILTLKKGGGMLGYRAYYENNMLILSFTNATASLSGARIVIDPGHGGNDPGASGFYPGLDEREINAQIAAKLASVLKSHGATVLVTTQGTSLAQRLAAATAFQPHILVSIHGNSSARNPSASGTEVYYFYGMSKPLASAISAQVASALGVTNRGAKSGYFYITRTSQFAAVLVETGFVSNQQEYARLINGDYQNRIASGIANALASILKSANTGMNLSVGSNLNSSSSSDNSSLSDGERIPLGGGSDANAGSGSDTSSDSNTTSDQSIALSVTSLQLGINAQHTLSVTGSASPVSWHSTNTAIVTVDSSGVITGVASGRAEVVATVDSVTYTCAVTVSDAASDGSTGHTLEGNAQIAISSMSNFSLTPEFSGDVDWVVDANSVVEIYDYDDHFCVLRGVSAGSSTLYAIDSSTRSTLAKIDVTVS